MATGSKYDMAASSPDGHSYQNRQRGPYAAASLEKSGSFREGTESRMPSSLPNMLRPGSTSSQGDVNNLVQSLISDLKPVVLDQKFLRPGEVKRSISSAVGISSEDSIPAALNTRPLPSSSLEELRRMKGNINECSIKARDRAKAFSEATSKIDKYSHNMSRKRPRAEISSSERPNVLMPGGSIPRTGPQSHLSANGLENGPQKSEERAKSVGPSRRVRTTRGNPQMDARANGITRPSGPVERDKDVPKLVSGGATPLEEKGRVLPTSVDGWDKSKMKKKRSVIKPDISAAAVLAKPFDGDREPKRGTQQKLISDARPRSNNTHGIRSGPVTTVTGVEKPDSVCQQNALGMRPFPRNDQENGSLPNDRRDRPVGSDKDGVTLKAANKPNCREDNCVASPTATAQVNASTRGPRSNSGSLSKVSPNIHRAVGHSDDWEHPQGVNKLSAAVGTGALNRKRSTSTCSPAPPVAQWVGQRPQKITRVARRSNLIPAVSGHNEISASDITDSAAINDDVLAFTRQSSSNASQQSKMKGDHVSSSGFSESEESGAADNKSKEKGKKCNEIEERASLNVQKVASVVPLSRKNKPPVDEDLGDGDRRQGRIGRGFTPIKSGTPAAIEKLDNVPWRGGKISCEKIESKPGRPPTKKWSERKGYARPRQPVNNAPIEFAGESDDDREELLTAANAALDTSNRASFWKQMEPVFGFLSAEDIAFFQQQVHLVDEAAANTYVVGDGQNSKGELGCLSLPSTPAISGRDDCSAVSNGVGMEECDGDLGIATQKKNAEPFLEQLVRGNGAANRVSVCQALLSAIIEEEEIGDFNYANNKGEEYLYDDPQGFQFEFAEELKSKGSNFHSLGTFQAPERTPNGYRINAGRTYHGEVAYEKLGSNGISLELNIEGHAFDGLLPSRGISACTEFQYNQMCIDDRILLELSEIGLYPEPVPDLAQSEEEDIGKGINILEEKLHKQVMKKRSLLTKLEKGVTEAREHQQRALERTAMDKLVGMAYDKYMACWGPNASSKNVSKTTKHAALAFVKRTLARNKKFEETGISCFSEPPFREMFLSIPSQKISAERVDIAAFGEAANQSGPTLHTELTSTVNNNCMAPNPAQGVDIRDKHSDVFRSVNHLSEQMVGREDPWSNKVKKRELLLDDVVGTASASLRTPSGLGGSLVSGAKGKRSERDREGKGQNRDTVSRNGTAKIGRPALSNAKGERKNRTKPKQKIAQLSTSVNGLLNKPAELSKTVVPSAPKSREMVSGGSSKKDGTGLLSSHVGAQNVSDDAEAIDFCGMQLPEIDGDFGGNGQDLATWFGIDEDGLQDQDCMGLEIPMDDLSEVNMMI